MLTYVVSFTKPLASSEAENLSGGADLTETTNRKCKDHIWARGIYAAALCATYVSGGAEAKDHHHLVRFPNPSQSDLWLQPQSSKITNIVMQYGNASNLVYIWKSFDDEHIMLQNYYVTKLCSLSIL